MTCELKLDPRREFALFMRARPTLWQEISRAMMTILVLKIGHAGMVPVVRRQDGATTGRKRVVLTGSPQTINAGAIVMHTLLAENTPKRLMLPALSMSAVVSMASAA